MLTPDQARALLFEAARERDAAGHAWDEARERLYSTIRVTSDVLPQNEIARLADYSRERVRQITHLPPRIDNGSATSSPTHGADRDDRDDRADTCS